MSELPDDYYEPMICKTPLPKQSFDIPKVLSNEGLREIVKVQQATIDQQAAQIAGWKDTIDAQHIALGNLHAELVDSIIASLQQQATIDQQAVEIHRLNELAANRLIGLCKCGVERDQQAAQIAELREVLSEDHWAEHEPSECKQCAALASTDSTWLTEHDTKVRESVTVLFNGYDTTKLPSVLISLSAKLFGNGGMFWEQTIDLMPDKVQRLLNRLRDESGK